METADLRHHHGALAGLNSDHVKALTTDEVGAPPPRSSGDQPDQLDGLTTAGVVALTTAQVGALKSDQVNPEHRPVAAIETGDIKSMTTTALRR